MIIASWNVNGIRASLRNGGLASFVKKHQPDVLCLQEIKARPDQAQPDLKGYLEYWNPADRPGYAGTAIFAKTKPLAVIHDLPPVIEHAFGLDTDPFGNSNREGRIIAAEFPDLWVVSVYVPNSKRELSRLDARCTQWEPAMLAFMQGLEAGKFGTCSPKPVVFCGDMNVAHNDIDLARPKQNHRTHGFTDEERACFQGIMDAGFVDTFRSLHPTREGAYTWWSLGGARERNIGWRIDYCIASQSLEVTSADIYPDQTGSDHCPVSVTLNIPG